MDAQTLKELMNPKNVEKQARYENARSAVAMAYSQARHLSSVSGNFTTNAAGEEEYVPATVEQQTESFMKVARLLIPQIEADLNECLKRLEVADGDASTATA